MWHNWHRMVQVYNWTTIPMNRRHNTAIQRYISVSLESQKAVLFTVLSTPRTLPSTWCSHRTHVDDTDHSYASRWTVSIGTLLWATYIHKSNESFHRKSRRYRANRWSQFEEDTWCSFSTVSHDNHLSRKTCLHPRHKLSAVGGRLPHYNLRTILRPLQLLLLRFCIRYTTNIHLTPVCQWKLPRPRHYNWIYPPNFLTSEAYGTKYVIRNISYSTVSSE